MTTLRNLLAGVAAVAALSAAGAASAQTSPSEEAQGTATATLIAAVSATQQTGLNFGTIIRSSTASGSVTITPAGVVSDDGGATVTGSGQTAASFTVSGPNNQEVDLSAEAFTIANGAVTLNVTPSVSDESITLSSSGTGAFTVGGTLAIPANATVGTYSGDFVVVMSYN